MKAWVATQPIPGLREADADLFAMIAQQIERGAAEEPVQFGTPEWSMFWTTEEDPETGEEFEMPWLRAFFPILDDSPPSINRFPAPVLS